MGQNKESLIDKAKQRIHSPLPMGKWMFSHFQESRATLSQAKPGQFESKATRELEKSVISFQSGIARP